MYSAYSTKDCFVGDFFSHFSQNRRKKGPHAPEAYSPCFEGRSYFAVVIVILSTPFWGRQA